MGNLGISKLGEAIDIYDTTEEKWDDRSAQLGLELGAINEEIREEKDRLREKVDNNLRSQVIIDFVATAGQVEIDLSYVVSRAYWKPAYDIRVDMQNTAAPAKVTYKALVSQQTGESWKDVSLILETAVPTFGKRLPTLGAWYIREKGRNPSRIVEAEVEEESEDELASGFEADLASEPDPQIQYNPSFVTSVGNVHATFSIANSVTIANDDKEYSIVIAELDLATAMTWSCIPKRESSAYLQATITNSSEYTLLSGGCSIYLGQSFVGKSLVPVVSPQETFDCNFGVDPSIRITYHMSPRKVSESGFINKAQKHNFVSNITIYNTKAVDIAGLKLIDHIPVSKNAKIVVDLVQPKLFPPLLPLTTIGEKSLSPIIVAEGVVAQWSVMSGQRWDGRLEWICAIPAQSTIDLVLHWEVSAALMVDIDGL